MSTLYPESPSPEIKPEPNLNESVAITTVEIPEESPAVTDQTPVSEASPSFDTAMLEEALTDTPVWRRPGFLATAAATLAIGLGLYGLNREQPAQSVSLETSDEGTFDEPEAQGEPEVASSSEPEAIVPPSSSFYNDPSVASLAFAKNTIKTAEQAEQKQEIAKPEEKKLAAAKPEFLPLDSHATVRFAFNSAKLDQKTRVALDAMAKRMKTDKNLKLKLEGHADQRGTKQYNYRLGLARAKAAKAYLMKKGIAAARVSVVSFGKSRPAAKGQGEAAWAKNRRVELKEATLVLTAAR